ncbi:MAG: hypothetical protein ACJ8AD_15405 [Gemmatimonadaceae bacterium]
MQFAVVTGGIMATMFSAWVAVVYLAGGPRVFSAMGTSLHAVVLCYYVAGIAGGALVGLLLPLAGTLGGRMLVGSVAALVVGISAQTTLSGAIWHWDRTTLVSTTVLAVLMGMILGPVGARELRR